MRISKQKKNHFIFQVILSVIFIAKSLYTSIRDNTFPRSFILNLIILGGVWALFNKVNRSLENEQTNSLQVDDSNLPKSLKQKSGYPRILLEQSMEFIYDALSKLPPEEQDKILSARYNSQTTIDIALEQENYRIAESFLDTVQPKLRLVAGCLPQMSAESIKIILSYDNKINLDKYVSTKQNRKWMYETFIKSQSTPRALADKNEQMVVQAQDPKSSKELESTNSKHTKHAMRNRKSHHKYKPVVFSINRQ